VAWKSRLGPANKADRVEVSWPSGLKESFDNIAANQIVWIQEGLGLVKSDPFRVRSGR